MLYISYCCNNHEENLTQRIGFSQLFIVIQFLFWVANDVSLSQPKQKYPLESTIIDTLLTSIVLFHPLAVGVCCSPTELLLIYVVYVVVNHTLFILNTFSTRLITS